MLGSLGDMMSLFGNLSKLSKEYQSMVGQLKEQRVEAFAGGEMVKAVTNGLGELVDIKISEELASSGDREMLEDLVKSAVASAVEKSRNLAQERMGKLAEILPLGQLKGLLGQLE